MRLATATVALACLYVLVVPRYALAQCARGLWWAAKRVDALMGHVADVAEGND